MNTGQHEARASLAKARFINGLGNMWQFSDYCASEDDKWELVGIVGEFIEKITPLSWRAIHAAREKDEEAARLSTLQKQMDAFWGEVDEAVAAASLVRALAGASRPAEGEVIQ